MVHYSTNFDGLTAGAIAPGWVNTGAATYVVGTNAPVSGGQSFGLATQADGQVAVYTGSAQQANGSVQFAQPYQPTGGYNFTFRDDGTGNNHYALLFNASGSIINLYKRVAGGYASLGNSGTLPAFSVGQWYWSKLDFSGTTFRAKFWAVGTPEPSGWTSTFTDATFAAGYVGLRSAGGAAGQSLDNFYLGDSGDTFTTLIPATSASAGATLQGDGGTGIHFAGRWASGGNGVAVTVNAGAVADLVYAGGVTANAVFDLTGITSPPDVSVRVDRQGSVRRSLSAAVPWVPLNPRLPNQSAAAPDATATSSTHRARVVATAIYQSATNQWTTESGAVRLAAVEVDYQATLPAVGLPLDYAEFDGDSVTAAVRLLWTASANAGSPDTPYMDADAGWPLQVAEALGLNPIVCGCGGQGIVNGGSGGFPNAATAFPLIYAGVNWSPARPPKVWVCMQGYNDALGNVSLASFASGYAALLAAARAKYPNALLVAVVPPNIDAANVTAGGSGGFGAAIVTAAGGAGGNVAVLNYGTGVLTAIGGADYSDTIAHLNPGGATRLAQRMAADLAPLLAPTYTAAANVRLGTNRGDGTVGTLAVPTAAQVLAGVAVDATTGTVVLPTTAQVAAGTTFGPGGAEVGTLATGSGTPAAAVVGPLLAGQPCTVLLTGVTAGAVYTATSTVTGNVVPPVTATGATASVTWTPTASGTLTFASVTPGAAVPAAVSYSLFGVVPATVGRI